MKAYEFVTDVDERREVRLTLPPDLLPGTIRVIVLAPDGAQDETRDVWMRAISREWAAELADPREDIYTLDDGEPVDVAR